MNCCNNCKDMRNESGEVTHKRCNKCHEMKELTQFNMQTKTRRRADCKECRKKTNTSYYAKNKDRLKEKREIKKGLKTSQQ